jgi:allantoinase
LAAGYDADLVVLDVEAAFTVVPGLLWHRHKATPYEGRQLRGQVERTYLRGRKVFEVGRFLDGPGGQVLRRGP